MNAARRPVWVDATILLLAGVMFVSMIALGNWQMRRLAWKLDLIESVQTRAFGDPVPAPQDAAPEYLRVFATGTFAHDQSLRIKAVTEIGPGYWIMTPLVTDGMILWINRGFVPNTLEQGAWERPQGQQRVTGLVRLDQPGGTLLERNQPDTGRWVSADLSEMSRAAGLRQAQTAYFIDSEATGADWPRGGLTRLTFRNTHLVYALTWYAMAALFFVAMGYVIRGRLTGSH
ncbi:SURF1 family protein [uncultured Pseudosulfitobacter sp.]|uniref:SURF1 family protein n=1 Tax=uncultured Pseudosulfitobacter sp. TaxID=2854214 RepID=UPI0030D87B27